MKNLWVFLLLLIAFPLLVSAQKLELGGGYTHTSGDGGLDGFNIGAAAWITNRVSLAVDYDTGWDTSHLGVFELTQTGAVITKNHLQNILGGTRIAFPGTLRIKETHLARMWPFVEVQFGLSHLSSSIETPTTTQSQSASDNAFAWLLGG